VKRHLSWYAEKGPEGLLFVGEKGAPFRRTSFGRKWRRARADVGLPDGFRFYDLWHTGHTLSTRSGATLKDTMVRAGQSSEKAALIYQHSDEEAESASSILVTRSMRNPQVRDPGVLCCPGPVCRSRTITAPLALGSLVAVMGAGSSLWDFARSARTRSSSPAATSRCRVIFMSGMQLVAGNGWCVIAPDGGGVSRTSRAVTRFTQRVVIEVLQKLGDWTRARRHSR
jgi:hypothetical protein